MREKINKNHSTDPTATKPRSFLQEFVLTGNFAWLGNHTTKLGQGKNNALYLTSIVALIFVHISHNIPKEVSFFLLKLKILIARY